MVSAILLGAGRSRRMGRDKLSLSWGNRTVFEQCLQVLLRSKADEVIVVRGGRSKAVRDRTGGYSAPYAKKAKFVFNLCAEKGMSTSIQEGIKWIDPKSEGILIALGDQPLLKTRTIDALIRAFARGKRSIVVPVCRGERGHPVIFDRIYVKELLHLKGDEGGKSILGAHPERVVKVRSASRGVVADIDTWQGYKKSLKFHVPSLWLKGKGQES